MECSKRHMKTTLNVLPKLVQKNISHLRVFGRTYDELVQNQKICRDSDETYKERTYHYLLQCPHTTRWRESLLLHLPEERFHECSEAMIGLILYTQAKLQGTEYTRCKVPNSGRTRMNTLSSHRLTPRQSQLLDFETLIDQICNIGHTAD